MPFTLSDRGAPADSVVPVDRAADVFQFDDFVLDAGGRELHRRGQLVSAGQQTLLLLEQLVRHAGRIVGREAIHEAVWPGTSVSETSLRQAIWELRQVLGDAASTPRYVQTVRGRGYRFLAAVTPGRRRDPPSEVADDLVGRDAERARLREALDRATSEAGRAAVLRGAPGIGKSRLARALVLDAGTRDVTCLEYTAERDTGRAPFWPWLKLLDELLAQVSDDQRATILADAPFAARMLVQRSAPDVQTQTWFSAGPDLQRLYLFEELTHALTALIRERPLVLLLEDVQWFDEASLSFLAYFGAALPRTRTLLLLTCREVPRRENRPLARALDALTRGALNQVLELAPLSPRQVTLLLVSCGLTTAAEVADEVRAITLGNPLYTLEIARMLAAQAPACDETLFRDPPGALREVIQRRLSGLPETCLETVRAASVWGDACGVAEAAAVLEESIEVALARIDECVQHGILLDRTASLRFGFSHPLVAEVAYGMLSTVERSRLHWLAGCWLEQRPEAERAHAEALAHHFFCAAVSGGAEKAAHYATVCAERAFAATAFAAAVRHTDRALMALELTASVSPPRKLALELMRAEAQRAIGDDVPKVDAVILSLAERAKQLGDPNLFARAALGYDAVRATGHMQTSFAIQQNPVRIALLEEARTGIDPSQIALRIRLACALSFALTYGPARARRTALADEALALSREVGTPTLIVHALSFVHFTCSAPDAYDRQRQALDQLVELARTHNLKEVELGSRLQRVVLALYVGNLHDAERDGARASVLAEQLGSERARTSSLLLPLIKAFWSGDISEADRLTDAIYDAQPKDLHQYQAVHMTRKGAIEVLRRGFSQLTPLIAHLQAVLALAPGAVSTRTSLASALSAVEHEQARAHFDDLARDDFAALPEEASWLGDMIALGDCAVRLADRARAELVYAKLAPFHERMTFFYCDALPAGPVARGLAELATVLGDFAAAEAHLHASRALNTRLGAGMFLHYDALAEVRLLAAQRPPRWHLRASGLLREVTTAAERTGNRWLVDCARALHSPDAQIEGSGDVGSA